MTDSISVLVPGFRVTDANSNPVSGAKLKFYEAGTTTPKTVYSNEGLSVSLGAVVTCDGAGYPTSDGSTKVIIYTGTGLYKIVITDASDVVIATHDNVRGATTSPVDDGVGISETPVVSKTGNYSVVFADRGKLINANPTGGSFSITLPSAITGESGNGFRIGVRHVGSANQVSIVTVSGQTISFPDGSAGSKSLVGYGEGIWLVSDGANWHVDSYTPSIMTGGLAVFSVADRLSAPPVSPLGGARYIVGPSPVGLWSTFAPNDIAEANGSGGWIRYTPSEGWFAYDELNNLYTAFSGTVWVDQVGMGSAAQSILKHAVFEHQLANGTAGGAATAGAWTTRSLNTTVVNTIPGVSLSANLITLPVGTYLVTASQKFSASGSAGSGSGQFSGQQRLNAGTAVLAASNLYGLSRDDGSSASGAGLTFNSQATIAPADLFVVQVTTAGTLSLQYWVSAGNLGNASGEPAGALEIYARVSVVDLSSLQGAAGLNGDPGPNVGLDYQWNTATSGDPGTGKVLVNNANPTLATVLHISETNRMLASQGPYIATWDDSVHTPKGFLRVLDVAAPSGNFLEYRITGSMTDVGAYDTFPVAYVGGAGTVANNALVAVVFFPAGDDGATGPNVGLDYQWNTATSGDPGTGKILVNNATPSSATVLHISELNRFSASQSSYIATFDDSTMPSNKGTLRILDVANPGVNFLEYRITGSMTDVGAYDTFPVAYVGGSGTIANNAIVAVAFFQTGDLASNITAGTPVTLSGSTVDITGLPSSIKRLTLMIDGLSTTGTNNPLIQLGDSGGIETTGYVATSGLVSGSPGAGSSTSGFLFSGSHGAAVIYMGSITFSLLDAATNTWVAAGIMGRGDTATIHLMGGSKSLSAVLDRIRVTTTGADTFDAGKINVFYEL